MRKKPVLYIYRSKDKKYIETLTAYNLGLIDQNTTMQKINSEYYELNKEQLKYLEEELQFKFYYFQFHEVINEKNHIQNKIKKKI